MTDIVCCDIVYLKRGDFLSNASDMIRGHTDTIILAYLMNGDSYGYAINKKIKEKTNNAYELKEATLYCVFKRLEELGFIVSYWGSQETGARRRYYKITEEGKKAYYYNKENYQKMKSIIDSLIEGEDGCE